MLYQVFQLNRALHLRWVWHGDISCFFPHFWLRMFLIFINFLLCKLFSSIFAIVPSISEFFSSFTQKEYETHKKWNTTEQNALWAVYQGQEKFLRPQSIANLSVSPSELFLLCLFLSSFFPSPKLAERREELINYSRMKCWVESYDDTNIFSSLIHRTEKYRNFHGLTYILINFW